MSLEVIFDNENKTNTIQFKKNETIVHTQEIPSNRFGYYPAVGLHSLGEAVQILQRHFWEDRTEEVT